MYNKISFTALLVGLLHVSVAILNRIPTKYPCCYFVYQWVMLGVQILMLHFIGANFQICL